MPFNHPTPYSLTMMMIYAQAPTVSGIYGISNAREWIYIGETDNIRRALLAHLQDSGATVMQRQPTGFVFESCDQVSRPARQDRLVQEYEPTCNRRSMGGA
jgi:predicted GIY-YIG superfamily endonuclease